MGVNVRIPTGWCGVVSNKMRWDAGTRVLNYTQQPNIIHRAETQKSTTAAGLNKAHEEVVKHPTIIWERVEQRKLLTTHNDNRDKLVATVQEI
jgi:hypothetical protein